MKYDYQAQHLVSSCAKAESYSRMSINSKLKEGQSVLVYLAYLLSHDRLHTSKHPKFIGFDWSDFDSFMYRTMQLMHEPLHKDLHVQEDPLKECIEIVQRDVMKEFLACPGSNCTHEVGNDGESADAHASKCSSCRNVSVQLLLQRLSCVSVPL